MNPAVSGRSCLIISYGPVPTPDYQTIEGGGMRNWGLARGLRSHGVEVTVAIHESYPQARDSFDGVLLTNWSNTTLAALANRYDAVIVSYNMGDPSEIVVRGVGDHVQLILDAYVPIYVEISARKSEHLESEYISYMRELERFNLALQRGDYFLCANETQAIFYTGVLSALGRINPITYSKELIEIVPFGIHPEPVVVTEDVRPPSFSPDDYVILWFGGLYPWFDIRNLLRAVKRLSEAGKNVRLLVVGGKNPFNPNPVFFKQYDEARAFADEHKLTGKVVTFVDWVNFDERVNWWALANIVVSLNTEGQENRYSWRTRVMDFIWGELPILTNGGDPLSDSLIAAHAARKIAATDEDTLTDELSYLYDHPEVGIALKKHLRAVKPTYEWPFVTEKLAALIQAGRRAPDLILDPTVVRQIKPSRLSGVPGGKYVTQAGKLSNYVKTYGLRSSVRQAQYTAKHLLRRHLTDRQYVFISHPLDQTGGPLVLMEMIEEFCKQVKPSQIRLIAPHIDPFHLRRLRQLGVAIDGMDPRLGRFALGARLSLKPDDFVMLNTVAIAANYRDTILQLLRDGQLDHAYWYIHEDDPEVQFGDEKLARKIREMMAAKKLTLGVPSHGTQRNYAAYLDRPVELIALHVDVPNGDKVVRAVSDFSKLRFVLSGIASSGRKGQVLVLAAFKNFVDSYYRGHESEYRDFDLTFIGLGNDYLSRQLVTIGENSLAERFKPYETVSRAKALALMSECNVVVCDSLMETFGLYIAEGMFMGHVVVRNDCSGYEEQLKPGENGFQIDTLNLEQVTSTLEQILNRTTTSNEQLQRMGQKSQEMVAPFADNRYYDQFMKLEHMRLADR